MVRKLGKASSVSLRGPARPGYLKRRKRLPLWKKLNAWWLDPQLKYRGNITVPPKGSQRQYQFWRKCAWAMIYNPKTPEWLRLLLRDRVKKPRVFDKIKYRRGRWIRLFNAKWRALAFKQGSMRWFIRRDKVRRVQGVYLWKRSIVKGMWIRKKKNKYIIQFTRSGRLKEAVWKPYTSMFYRLLGNHMRGLHKKFKFRKTTGRRHRGLYKKRRSRRKRKLLQKNFFSGLYTAAYLKRTGDSLMLGHILKRGFVKKNAWARYSSKILKAYLYRISRQSLGTFERTSKMRLQDFVYTFFWGCGISTFTLLAGIVKGLVTINSRRVDLTSVLCKNDLLFFSSRLFVAVQDDWQLSKSWAYWVNFFYEYLRLEVLPRTPTSLKRYTQFVVGEQQYSGFLSKILKTFQYLFQSQDLFFFNRDLAKSYDTSYLVSCNRWSAPYYYRPLWYKYGEVAYLKGGVEVPRYIKRRKFLAPLLKHELRSKKSKAQYWCAITPSRGMAAFLYGLLNYTDY